MSARPGLDRRPGRYTILAAVLAVQTFANVGPLGLPAIASLIRDDLGLTLTQAGSFLSAYYIGPSLMSLPAGAMADRWGIARMLILGQVVIAAGLLAVSAAGSYPAIAALLIVAGVGYGMLNPTSTKAVMAWFPPAQRATVVGLKQVGLPFGGALGAALLPVVVLAAGWRRAVVAGAVLIAVTGRIVFGVLSDRTFGGRRRAPLVLAGCGSAVCSLVIAFTGPGTPAALLVPLALVFGFVGVGWNGVQHTLMAELAGARTAGAAMGLGLAVSSVGVTVAPPIFSWCVDRAGGYVGPWIGLALAMVGAVALLGAVRERRRS